MKIKILKMLILKNLLKRHISKIIKIRCFSTNKQDYDGENKLKIKIKKKLKLLEFNLLLFKLSDFNFFALILAIENKFACLENYS